MVIPLLPTKGLLPALLLSLVHLGQIAWISFCEGEERAEAKLSCAVSLHKAFQVCILYLLSQWQSLELQFIAKASFKPYAWYYKNHDEAFEEEWCIPMTRQGLCQYLSTNGNGMKDLTWKHLFAGTRDFMACNHLRSYKYYSDSIIYPDGFLGYSCTSYDVFESVSTSQSLRMDCVKNSCSFLFIHLKSSLLMVLMVPEWICKRNKCCCDTRPPKWVYQKEVLGWMDNFINGCIWFC